MKLTDIERGQRTPADYFAGTSCLPPDGTSFHETRRFMTADESRRRQRVAIAARERFAENQQFAAAVGVTSRATRNWLNGTKPVPDGRIERVEEIAGGDA